MVSDAGKLLTNYNKNYYFIVFQISKCIKDGKSFEETLDENEEILTLALMGQVSGSSSPQVMVRNKSYLGRQGSKVRVSTASQYFQGQD